LILSPEYSDRLLVVLVLVLLPPELIPTVDFFEELLCLELLISSLWHQSHRSIGSDDSL
jgi:hypothetical protein